MRNNFVQVLVNSLLDAMIQKQLAGTFGVVFTGGALHYLTQEPARQTFLAGIKGFDLLGGSLKFLIA